jgi:hypothetical protein
MREHAGWADLEVAEAVDDGTSVSVRLRFLFSMLIED